MYDSVWPHRQQPTRLICPWDSPGKNAGVGCHFLLQCMKVKSEREVAQSCLTLLDPMDCSLPGSSVHGIFQARVLEWGVIAYISDQIRADQSLSHVRLFATPWIEARQAFLSITNSQSLFKLISIKLRMPINHLILCQPLFLLPSTFPSIRVFFNESVLHIRWFKILEFQLQL